MRCLPSLLLLLLPLLLAVEGKAYHRLTALWNLEQMSECVLHYNALVYNNYGCWCGIGGSHEPVDEIDRCCMNHDHCYDKAIDDGFCFDVPVEYLDGYSWNCVDSVATCAEHQDPCKAALCECDRLVVNCWSKEPKPAEKKKCNHTGWLGWLRKKAEEKAESSFGI